MRIRVRAAQRRDPVLRVQSERLCDAGRKAGRPERQKTQAATRLTWVFVDQLPGQAQSPLSGSNRRPPLYKSGALAS